MSKSVDYDDGYDAGFSAALGDCRMSDVEEEIQAALDHAEAERERDAANERCFEFAARIRHTLMNVGSGE